MSMVIKTENLSRWYGTVLGVADVNLSISSGIKGLLGPNGAGKSTLLKLLTCQLKPQRGQFTIFGENPNQNRKVLRRVGYVPEIDVGYPFLSAIEFLQLIGELKGIFRSEAARRSAELLQKVGLAERSKERMRSFSYGMRQRVRFAAALINDPELIILDEPLRGIDPFWRLELIKIIRQLKEDGKTVVVSSHILPEIESLTEEIILIHHGKVLAEGSLRKIRELLDNQPHRILIGADKQSNLKILACRLIENGLVSGVSFESSNRLIVQSNRLDLFFEKITGLIGEENVHCEQLLVLDDNLQAVFDYLTRR